MRTVLAFLLAFPSVAQAQTAEKPGENGTIIEGIGLSRDIPCEGRNIGIYGADNRIALTGDCGSVVVNGSGHHVSLHKADELVLSGAEHTVIADAVATLSVQTTGHTVTAALHSNGRPAEVEIDGAEQTLNLTLSSQTNITVAGTEQVVNWSLDAGAPEPRIEVGGIDNVVNRLQ